jgi:phage gpG-like protein
MQISPENFIKKLMEDNREFKLWFEEKFPDVLGIEAVNFFMENFQNEGFTDTGNNKWPQVKRRINPPRPDRAAASRPILTGDTGDLGKSINYETGSNTVTVYSDKPYASAHNEGTSNAGRSHNVVIPKRQFIGHSISFEEKIVRVSSAMIAKLMK